MADLATVLTDPNFVNANPATKQAIFEKWAPQDPNFANANLEHSILEYTNLRHTNFRGAKLKGSHVYGVQGIARDMANFEGSTISEASFEEQLTHTDYGGSLLDPENRVKSRHRGQDSSIERRAREDWRKKNITDR